MSNLDQLFVQINTNGDHGYRLLGPLLLGNFCTLYIRDTPRDSEFVYQQVSKLKTIEDFLAPADELGARGYRHAGDTLVSSVINGTGSYPTLFLFFRDTTDSGCTHSYSSAPLTDTAEKFLALLQQTAGDSFQLPQNFPYTRGSIHHLREDPQLSLQTHEHRRHVLILSSLSLSFNKTINLTFHAFDFILLSRTDASSSLGFDESNCLETDDVDFRSSRKDPALHRRDAND